MKRRIIRGLRYLSALLVLFLLLVLTTQWGLQQAFNVLASRVPGKLTVQSLEGDLLGPVALTGLQYQDDYLDITVTRLDIDWHLLAMAWQTLDIRTLNAEGVVVRQLAVKKSAAAETTISLPITIKIADARLQQLSWQSATANQPVSINQIKLRGRADDTAVTLRELQVNGESYQLSLAGKLQLAAGYPMDFKVQWAYHPEFIPELSGQGTLRGDIHKLLVEQQLGENLRGQLQAQVTELTESLRWQATIKLHSLDLQRWQASAPAFQIAGMLTAAGDSRAMQLDSSLQAKHPQHGVLATTASLHTANTFETYDFKLAGNWQDRQRLYHLDYELAGEGNRKQVSVQRIVAREKAGSLRGRARYTWQPHAEATAELALQNFNTALFWPQWPGRVGANFTLSTRQQHAKPAYQFELHALDGHLRGYPLKGKAKAVWQASRLTVENANLRLGGTSLDMKGKYDDRFALQWHLSSDNINSLLPAAEGKIQLDGELRGTAVLPQLQLRGNASQLAYADYYLEQGQIDLNFNLAEQSPLHLSLQLQGAYRRTLGWHQASLQVDGVNEAHKIQLQLNDTDASMLLQGRGGYTTGSWQGEIEVFTYEQSPLDRWTLAVPATIKLSSQEQELTALCLQQNNAQLCVQAHWFAQHGSGNVRGKALPLAILNYWLPESLSMRGQADLQFDLATDKVKPPQASLRVSVPADSAVLTLHDYDEQLAFGASQFDADLDAAGLQLRSAIPLRDGGGLSGQVMLADWSVAQPFIRTQSIAGELRINRLPVQTLTRFVPEAGKTEGVLQAEIQLAGTLGQPQITGGLNWEKGSVEIPAPGITLRDINARIHSAAGNTLQYNVTAKSGKGDIQLQGQTQLDASTGWLTQLHLHGTNMEVFNTTEALVRIDPDINVAIAGNHIKAEGSVTVPFARVRPRSLPAGSAALSRDVVIISGQDKPEVVERWKLHASVRVNLGDNVDFDGFGVSGKLRGSLLLLDAPGKLTTGQGEVSIVDGIYRMSGQDLTIDRGRLLFANTLLTDPGVDVEATREVDSVTVGVRLRGTLRKPELTVFSEPAMSESDALAYLIMGRPINQPSSAGGQSTSGAAATVGIMTGDFLATEIGGHIGVDELRVDAGATTEQTALVVGKYLSPKLYVRYFTGIVESSNIVQFRYQLSKHVQLQTEGGYRGTQSVTGGDIIFTVEY